MLAHHWHRDWAFHTSLRCVLSLLDLYDLLRLWNSHVLVPGGTDLGSEQPQRPRGVPHVDSGSPAEQEPLAGRCSGSKRIVYSSAQEEEVGLHNPLDSSVVNFLFFFSLLGRAGRFWDRPLFTSVPLCSLDSDCSLGLTY
jgi:hypothetical protein